MPYTRNRSWHKQNGFGKKPWKNGASTYNKNYRSAMAANYRRAATVGPAARMNYRTGGYMGMEKKFADFRVDADAFTTVWAGGEMEDGTALSVSAVSQGDGESQRDGRVYYIHSINIKGHVNTTAEEAAAAPGNDQIIRLALVWDKQTNGAQLNAEDVFKTIASGDDIESYRNLQFVQRFAVLRDMTFKMPVGSSTMNEGAVNSFASSGTKRPFNMNYTFRTPIKVTCSGTTAAIASITDNSLHIIGTASTTATTLDYTSRLRFTG